MENPIKLAQTTLTEELRLVEQLNDLARKTHDAILEGSVQELVTLGARHQNAVVRLEIIRQSQGRVLSELRKAAGLGRSAGFSTALSALGADEELSMIERVHSGLLELSRQNRRNARLLEKKYTGVRAFQQVIDLVYGVDRVYCRDGEVRRVAQVNQIEESR